MKLLKKLFLAVKNRKWLIAQKTEKMHWSALWETNKFDNELIKSEIIKHTFLIKNFEKIFKTDISKIVKNKSILDVGCGPASYIARMKEPKNKYGVDPLEYPNWVYREYKKNQFTVYKSTFEDFKSKIKFDVILFYNALQHFRNLNETANNALDKLSKDGQVLLIEYLHIPTDKAHIQYLTKKLLDETFSSSGFVVRSKTKLIRLPGYVEMGGGMPALVYFGLLSKK